MVSRDPEIYPMSELAEKAIFFFFKAQSYSSELFPGGVSSVDGLVVGGVLFRAVWITG